MISSGTTTPSSHDSSATLRVGLVRRTVLMALVAFIGMLLSGPTTAAADAIPADAIHRSSQQVMEHNDFRSARRRMLEEVPVDDMDEGFLENLLNGIGQAVSDFFSWLFGGFNRPVARPTPPPPATGSSWSFWDSIDLSRLLVIVTIVVFAIAAVWLLAGALKQHQHDPDRGGIPSIDEADLEISVPPGELAASTYESRALQLAQQGDFSQAIRELLLGSMSWIERAGLIRFRKGLTNRDYVRAVWRRTEQRSAYLVTGTEFELVFFGRRIATEEMFDRCLNAFRGAFHEEVAVEPADQ